MSELKQLFSDLGLARDEGLVFAHIPQTTGDARGLMFEEEFVEGTLYSIGDTAIDYIATDGKPVKWWKFKMAARDAGYNYPEPFWSGAAEDFRVQLLPEVAKEPDEGSAMAVRSYHRGPWITLTKEELAKYE